MRVLLTTRNAETREITMRILASVLFYPMLWFRAIVLIVGRFVSSVGMIAAVIMALVSCLTIHRLWLEAGLCTLGSFIIFLMLQIYDSILFRLNPTGRTLILYQ